MDYDARVRHGGGGVCFVVNMAWRFVNYFRLTHGESVEFVRW